MYLDKKKFALAGAEIMAIWYIICAALVAVAPNLAVKSFGWMVHLVDLKPGVGFPEVIYGFIQVIILSYLTAFVFAWLHNRAVKSA